MALGRLGRTMRRVLLGSALGLAAGVTVGCLQDEDFVAEYATEVCRMARDCGRELYLPGEEQPLPATEACESMIIAHYDTCRADCEFERAKARRCLRRLRNNECNTQDDSDEAIPLVCDAVFQPCSGGADQELDCGAPRCSVGGSAGAGALPLLGLLLLGLRRRRR